MAKYRVKTTCYGFRRGYYREGDIVDINLEKGEELPRHFELIDDKPSAPSKGRKGKAPETEVHEPHDLAATHDAGSEPKPKPDEISAFL